MSRKRLTDPDGWLVAVALALAIGAIIHTTGCQQPVPVCEPSASRCNGDRLEVCTPEGQWILGDQCADFGPGEWVCRAPEGSPAACLPKEPKDQR
jgi:hypothetical protein